MDFIPVCTPLLDGKEIEYVTDAVSTGWISSSGSYVKAFEEKFAEYCGVDYAVSVCNGTVALHLALTALGIGKGDEVIIPDFTMIASAFAVCYTGAKPIFVDAEQHTWNIDVSRIEEKITERTKAIMPVHIFGNPCNMKVIQEIAQKHGISVIEDAAQAHGAEFKGKKTGALSDIAAFSFFANKNLTTGEGGMVVTNDKKLYEKALYHKNLCFNLDGPRNYIHEDIGFNYRMSNIHAAIGLAQVEKADNYKQFRIQNGKKYRERLNNIPGLILQEDQDNALNVFWMNGVLIEPEAFGCARGELLDYLKSKGIDTRLFFSGMHRQPSLINYCGDQEDILYPITNNLELNGFYLPSGSNLNGEQINFICNEIETFQAAQLIK